MSGKWKRQPAKPQEDDDAPRGPKGSQFMWACNILNEVKLTKKKILYMQSQKIYKYYETVGGDD